VLSISLVAVLVWSAPVGTILIVVTYTQSLLSRLHQVQRSLKNVVKALGDARSMMTILETEATVQDVRHPRPFRLTGGAVVFDHVDFGYPGA
jgi:ABC-type multidrug transport system fused ATPase/permease subunit